MVLCPLLIPIINIIPYYRLVKTKRNESKKVFKSQLKRKTNLFSDQIVVIILALAFINLMIQLLQEGFVLLNFISFFILVILLGSLRANKKVIKIFLPLFLITILWSNFSSISESDSSILVLKAMEIGRLICAMALIIYLAIGFHTEYDELEFGNNNTL